MKLVTYLDGTPRIGVVDQDDTVWNLRALMTRFIFETERTPDAERIATLLVPDDMVLFVRLNHGRLGPIHDAVEHAHANRERLSAAGLARALADTTLLPPVLRPSKVLCCGNSYGVYLQAQVDGGLMPPEKWPQEVKMSFMKPPSALVGHGEALVFPPDSEQWDYENELSIIIGRTASNIPLERADDYIFGYTILNDACVRDIPAWTGGLDSPRGKAPDTLAPLGPCIVPSEYLGRDPNDLRIRTLVDGEVRQDDRTSGLLWPVQRIIAFVSRYITLVPGDVVSTGSTTGNAYITGKFLREGQVIQCEIEGIGTLENPIRRRRWLNELPPLAGG